ncbi:S-methyl-5-thioribose-1-phosphate isomerase [Peptoniphilaceae bacterium SGI.131]
MDKNILAYDTVNYDDQEKSLVIIDQTKLPNIVEMLHLTKAEDIWEAINVLRVRGAPAIGVSAAIGLYVVCERIMTDDTSKFIEEAKKQKEYLASSRPTAVNLFWALNRMEKVLDDNSSLSVRELKDLLKAESLEIREEDIRMCKSIAEYGLTLIKDGSSILTHCNAGQLATVKYGTALGPMHLGRERGMNFKVFTDETRPLLQGARLSSFELYADGIDTTVICDNMASQVMKNGWVDIVFVGADRIAANGDACNKIGTSGVAILAKYYNVPFYVLAPTSTIDMSIEKGEDIPIEQRPGHEVTQMWYKDKMVVDGVKVYNPAFDFTDNELISGIITEHGILRPPFNESLKALFEGLKKNK